MLSNIGASIGKVFKIPKLDVPMSLAPNSIILKFFNGIVTEFFEYLFKSFVGQNYLQMLSSGAAMPKFNKTDLRVMLVPIAPTSEQIKIVEKVQILFQSIDLIDNLSSDVSVLSKSIKSKILNLAIQGKLVPQNPEDEPASVLLERIKEEKEELIKQGKIKRDKKESIIFKGDDNSYYVAPNGTNLKIEDYVGYTLPKLWNWVTLKDIATISSGKTPTVNEISTTGKIPYFKVSDMNVLGNEKYMNIESNFVTPNYRGEVFKKGTFIFPKNGGAVLTNKKRILTKDSVVDLNTGTLKMSEYIDHKFAYYLFLTIDFTKLYHGSTIPTVNSKIIENLIFAIPPINEQKRIVEKIENIFLQLDKIINNVT